MSKDNSKPKAPRGATQVLPEIRNGHFVKELSAHLREVYKKVEETRLGGKITITLALKPLQGSDNGVVIMDDMKVAMPKKKAGETIFYGDKEGSLTRNDPNQMELQGFEVIRNDGAEDDTPAVRRVNEE